MLVEREGKRKAQEASARRKQNGTCEAKEEARNTKHVAERNAPARAKSAVLFLVSERERIFSFILFLFPYFSVVFYFILCYNYFVILAEEYSSLAERL